MDKAEKLFSVGVTFNKRLYDSEHQEIVKSMEDTYPNMDFFVYHENKFEKERYDDDGVKLEGRDHLHVFDVFEEQEWLHDFLNDSPFKTSHTIGTPGTFDPPHYWKRNGIYWFRKVVAINSLIEMNVIKTPYLLWLGCDTRFDKPLDDAFVEHISQFDISHIDRASLGLYTETDVLVFRIDNPGVKHFIRGWLKFYLRGDIFKEDRWDDCIAFDKTKAEFTNSLSFGSLSNRTGCPFNVYEYLFHWKRPLHKIRDKRRGI